MGQCISLYVPRMYKKVENPSKTPLIHRNYTKAKKEKSVEICTISTDFWSE